MQHYPQKDKPWKRVIASAPWTLTLFAGHAEATNRHEQKI